MEVREAGMVASPGKTPGCLNGGSGSRHGCIARQNTWVSQWRFEKAASLHHPAKHLGALMEAREVDRPAKHLGVSMEVREAGMVASPGKTPGCLNGGSRRRPRCITRQNTWVP